MTIPQAAFNAAVAAIQGVTADDKSIVIAALEAAMPHIRKQIARDIRAEMVGRNWNKTFLNGLEYGAYIAEKEENQ